MPIFQPHTVMFMTSTTKISFLLISSLSLAGCYSQGGWTPTVDAYGDPNAQFINRDMGDCQQLATQASGGTAKETAIGAGVGGLIGGATGAALGAAAGGIGGAAKQGFSAEDEYKRAYSSCMRNRGHHIVN